MKIITQTKRLIIKEIAKTDLDKMLALHSDPEVHIYLGNKTITSKAEMLKAIESIKQQYIDFGVGRWAMIHKETDKFIGWTGLEMVTQEINGHKNFYDLGYRLMKKFWGQGFATESVYASLNYAFDTLNIDTVYAMADCNNAGSNRILEKVGLTFIDQFNFESVPHNWYKIDKKHYYKS